MAGVSLQSVQSLHTLASSDLANCSIILAHIHLYPALEKLLFQKSLGLAERHMYVISSSLSRKSAASHHIAECYHS